MVDGFAQFLTVGFSGRVGFLWTDVFHKADGDLWLAKTSYTRKMNDMATGSIRTVPIKCLS